MKIHLFHASLSAHRPDRKRPVYVASPPVQGTQHILSTKHSRPPDGWRSLPDLHFSAGLLWLLTTLILLLLTPYTALASVTAQAGPYRVEVVTTPTPIALGKAQLVIRLTDSAGRPVAGAAIHALTKMPGMSMGEREAVAVPQSGQPGVYAAPAQFAMEGGYGAALRIDGPQGSANAAVLLSTGQDTGTLANTSAAPQGQVSAGGASTAHVEWPSLLPWLLGGGVVAFIIFRVRRTGQKPNLRAVANRSVLGGLLLIGLMLAVANYAVNRYRRPGSMTPIEAQGMQMELPAPSGIAPVELAPVTRGGIANRVRYTGQAVGFVEQGRVGPRDRHDHAD